jgi:hypothetical protein
MTINVGHLYKKRTVRRLSGEIIDLVDEANGGYIIRRGQIVNQERYDELKKIEEDKIKAAQAVIHQKVDDNAPDRNVTAQEAIKNNSKMEELETKVNSMDSKLEAILNALNK